MGILKVFIAFFIIGIIESMAKDLWKKDQQEYCFEISMSILFAAWIISGQW